MTTVAAALARGRVKKANWIRYMASTTRNASLNLWSHITVAAFILEVEYRRTEDLCGAGRILTEDKTQRHARDVIGECDGTVAAERHELLVALLPIYRDCRAVGERFFCCHNGGVCAERECGPRSRARDTKSRFDDE